MVHAWLIIEPSEGDGTGIQRQFDGETYQRIEGEMKYTLMKIGGIAKDFEVLTCNTEGELLWTINPGTLSGLSWKVCPCTAEGVNIDWGGE